MPDNVKIVINALTMEGLPAQDPQITVLLLQTSEPQHTVAKWSFAFDSTSTLTFPIPEDTFPIWQVSVGFSRFDAGKNGSQFFMPRGQANVTMNLGVIRLTTEWRPRFQPLANLSAPRFDPFRDVLTRSELSLRPGLPAGRCRARSQSGGRPAATAFISNAYGSHRSQQHPGADPTYMVDPPTGLTLSHQSVTFGIGASGSGISSRGRLQTMALSYRRRFNCNASAQQATCLA